MDEVVQDPLSDVFSSSASVFLSGCHAWEGERTAAAKEHRLDDFPTGVLNLAAIAAMADECQKPKGFLRWCTEVAMFDQFLIESVPVPGPASDLKPSYVAKCVAAGVMRKLGRNDEKKGVVKLFDVPKADPTVRRIILDGRPVNSRLPRPPRLTLPNIHVLARLLADKGARWAQVVDMRGYFHQFPLSDDVSSFFGVRNGSTFFRWLRLPMGFSYAPYIAQSTSEILLGALCGVWAVVYLDDILIFGVTAEDVKARVAYVRDRILRAQGEVNERKSSPLPMQVIVFLGIEWDLRHDTYDLTQEWKAEAGVRMSSLLEKDEATLRDWWKLCGLVFRIAYVSRVKLCFLCGVLQFVRTWATRVAAEECTFDTVIQLRTACREPCQQLAEQYLLSPNFLTAAPHPPTTCSCALWSDASTTGWGVVMDSGGPHAEASWGQWAKEGTSGDMFFLELLAAEKALTAATTAGHRNVVLFVDNSAVKLVLEKGHSLSRNANEVLRRVFHSLRCKGAAFLVRWISTDVMPADQWSRRKGTSGYCTISSVRIGVSHNKDGFLPL